MTPERWTRVKDVLSLALKRPGDQRDTVLDRACADDPELRREVSELLASEREMGEFLSEPTLPDIDTPLEDATIARDLARWSEYEIIERLGSGGMAVVYKARDPRLNRVVAIKIIPGSDEVSITRFLREAEAQARINHDNVLKVYETGVVGTGAAGLKPRHYIAMQYVDGPTLLGVRDETTQDRKVELMLAIAEGLHAAHRQGLVHRDIKPSNILVERGPEGEKPYLLDFGLAIELGAPGLTKTGVVLGTPRYMPPERIRGGTVALDRRSDIYSLGATYYEFIAGTPPFAGGGGLEVLAEILKGDFPPLRKHQPAISPELEAIIGKCLEADPQNRYPSARALADDLRRYLDGEPVLARPAGAVTRIVKKARKHPRLAAAFAALALLIVTTVAWSGYVYWRAARQAELAQQLGQEIRDLDWLYRAAQMSPLHDVTPQKQQVQQRMARLEQMMSEVGSLAAGPVNYALGRGHLTLGDYRKAIEHLERAWDVGYRAPDAAMALGVAHGEAFRIETDRAHRIDDEKERAAQIRKLETAHRDRALQFLAAGRTSAIIPATFVEALIASNRGEIDRAITRASEAARETPWLFEASLLPAHLHFQEAYKTYMKGDVEAGYARAQVADRAYADAERIAPSSIDAHLGRCAVAGIILHMVMHRFARDPVPAYQQAQESCARALAVDPQQAKASRLYSEALRFWAGTKVQAREDPGDAYDRATELAIRAMSLSNGSRDASYTLAAAYLDRAWWESRTDRDPRPAIDRAVAIFEKLIADYRSENAANGMAQAFVLQGRYETAQQLDARASLDRAVGAYQTSLQINPTAAFHYSGIAKAALARADEHVRHGTDAKAALADVLRFLDQLDSASAARQNAIEMIRARIDATETRKQGEPIDGSAPLKHGGTASKQN